MMIAVAQISSHEYIALKVDRLIVQSIIKPSPSRMSFFDTANGLFFTYSESSIRFTERYLYAITRSRCDSCESSSSCRGQFKQTIVVLIRCLKIDEQTWQCDDGQH